MFFHPLLPPSLQLNCVSLFFPSITLSRLNTNRSRRAIKSRRLKGMIAHGKQGKVVFKKHSNLGGFQMLKHIHKDQLFSRADYWGNGYIIKVKQREQKQQPQQQQHSCILKLFFLTSLLLLPISAKFARKCKSAVSLLAGAVFMMRQLHDRPIQCQVFDQFVTE